jgi:hypothetical protein
VRVLPIFFPVGETYLTVARQRVVARQAAVFFLQHYKISLADAKPVLLLVNSSATLGATQCLHYGTRECVACFPPIERRFIPAKYGKFMDSAATESLDVTQEFIDCYLSTFELMRTLRETQGRALSSLRDIVIWSKYNSEALLQFIKQYNETVKQHGPVNVDVFASITELPDVRLNSSHLIPFLSQDNVEYLVKTQQLFEVSGTAPFTSKFWFKQSWDYSSIKHLPGMARLLNSLFNVPVTSHGVNSIESNLRISRLLCDCLLTSPHAAQELNMSQHEIMRLVGFANLT